MIDVLKILKKNVYGVWRFYPMCRESKILLKLVGKNTFNDEHLELLRSLGYTLRIFKMKSLVEKEE